MFIWLRLTLPRWPPCTSMHGKRDLRQGSTTWEQDHQEMRSSSLLTLSSCCRLPTPEITRKSLSVCPSPKIILNHSAPKIRVQRLQAQMIAEKAVSFQQAVLSMMIMLALFTNQLLFLSLSNKKLRMWFSNASIVRAEQIFAWEYLCYIQHSLYNLYQDLLLL